MADNSPRKKRRTKSKRGLSTVSWCLLLLGGIFILVTSIILISSRKPSSGSKGNENTHMNAEKPKSEKEGSQLGTVVTRPKMFVRKAFKFEYPATWTVDEKDKDFDPDHMFSIDASDGSMISFVVYEAENDLQQTLSIMANAQEKILHGVTKKEFKHWGPFDGLGVTLQGKLQGVFKCTIRIFTFHASNMTFVITEHTPDEERQQLLAGFQLIEKTFLVTK
jgi:hypothetical protein